MYPSVTSPMACTPAPGLPAVWAVLYEKYLGADWLDHLDDPAMWEKVATIPDEELWAVRRHLKNKLVNYANERTRQQWQNGTFTPAQVLAGGVFLEPYSLTIGFARRFATYKRANLMFRDFDRLMRIDQQSAHAGADHLCRQGAPRG